MIGTLLRAAAIGGLVLLAACERKDAEPRSEMAPIFDDSVRWPLDARLARHYAAGSPPPAITSGEIAAELSAIERAADLFVHTDLHALSETPGVGPIVGRLPLSCGRTACQVGGGESWSFGLDIAEKEYQAVMTRLGVDLGQHRQGADPVSDGWRRVASVGYGGRLSHLAFSVETIQRTRVGAAGGTSPAGSGSCAVSSDGDGCDPSTGTSSPPQSGGSDPAGEPSGGSGGPEVPGANGTAPDDTGSSGAPPNDPGSNGASSGSSGSSSGDPGSDPDHSDAPDIPDLPDMPEPGEPGTGSQPGSGSGPSGGDGVASQMNSLSAWGFAFGDSSGTNPVSGSATWSGVMVGAEILDPAELGFIYQGDAAIRVDFADVAADVAFTNIRGLQEGRTRDSMEWTDLGLTDGGFEIRSQYVSESDGASPTQITGVGDDMLQGRFFGPNHEEVGGVFQWDGLAGSFGAKRAGN